LVTKGNTLKPVLNGNREERKLVFSRKLYTSDDLESPASKFQATVLQETCLQRKIFGPLRFRYRQVPIYKPF